jgi:hypothetical protein
MVGDAVTSPASPIPPTKYYVKIHWQGFRMSRLLIVLFAFLVGAVAGGYWGEHYSHTAIALRRTRQTICPSVPPDTPMKEFPRACLEAMIPSPNRK